MYLMFQYPMWIFNKVCLDSVDRIVYQAWDSFRIIRERL